MKKYLSLILICSYMFVALITAAYAQQNRLTNDRIIALVKAGTSDNTIISLISQYPNEFDASIEALVDLHDAGVSNAIINAIKHRVASRPSTDHPPVVASAPKGNLTSDKIIALSQAGVSDSIIISLINKTQTKFDLSAEEMIRLKQGGVSNSLISAMVGGAPGGSIESDQSEAELGTTANSRFENSSASTLPKSVFGTDKNEFGVGLVDSMPMGTAGDAFKSALGFNVYYDYQVNEMFTFGGEYSTFSYAPKKPTINLGFGLTVERPDAAMASYGIRGKFIQDSGNGKIYEILGISSYSWAALDDTGVKGNISEIGFNLGIGYDMEIAPQWTTGVEVRYTLLKDFNTFAPTLRLAHSF